MIVMTGSSETMAGSSKTKNTEDQASMVCKYFLDIMNSDTNLNSIGHTSEARDKCFGAMKPIAENQALEACKDHSDKSTIPLTKEQIMDCAEILAPEYLRYKVFYSCRNIIPSIYISTNGRDPLCGKAIC